MKDTYIMKTVFTAILLTATFLHAADEKMADENITDQDLCFIPGQHPFDQEIEDAFHSTIVKRLAIMEELNFSSNFKQFHQEIKEQSLTAMARRPLLKYEAATLYREIMQDETVSRLFHAAKVRAKSGEALYEWQQFREAADRRLILTRRKRIPSMKDIPLKNIKKESMPQPRIRLWLEINKELELTPEQETFFKVWHIVSFSIKQCQLSCKKQNQLVPSE